MGDKRVIRQKICFVAEGLSIDNATNQVSAFGIMEGVGAESFPMFVQKLAFFSLFEREPGDPAQVRGEFTVSLGDEILLRQATEFDFGAGRRTRTVFRLMGLVVPRPGNVVFRLVLAGQTVPAAEYAVAVTATKPAQVSTPAVQPAGNATPAAVEEPAVVIRPKPKPGRRQK